MGVSPLHIAVVGGGAAGFFAAMRAATVATTIERPVLIRIYESSAAYLKKVRISGGGRCNVTHNCFEPRALAQNYPRGSKELLSPFQKFQPRDTIEWFQQRGVEIIAEDDGRMFPSTHTSETIIDCFTREIKKWNIELVLNASVKNIEVTDETRFLIRAKDREDWKADRVLIATGSAPSGYELARQLGHTITDLAPSLFSFKIEHPLLTDLSGLSFPTTRLKLTTPQKTFKQDGPTLITHWGLSGPAILKLSAWAAREMKNCDYKAQLTVNWLGLDQLDDVVHRLQALKESHSKSQLKNEFPREISRRFWQQILTTHHIPAERLWADLSKKHMLLIAQQLFATSFEILGKNRFKDEFVECGGVDLKEIDFKTLQSRIRPGLYFAGELLDIDGITGGFNFQNAWSTAWIAASHMVAGNTALLI